MIEWKNMKNQQTTETESPQTPLEKIDRNLSEVFGTKPMEVQVIDTNNMVIDDASDEEEKIETDSDHVRSNMYSLLQQGNDALQYAIELAKQSDSPRAFEVVGTLMKNLADMNMQLMDSHEKKQKLTKKQPKEEPSKVVNNSIVFNGSTAELNKMLEDMKKTNS